MTTELLPLAPVAGPRTSGRRGVGCVAARRRACMLGALLAALLAAPAPLLAQPAEQEGWAYELANELMSPYCPGRALSECPSPQAAELRAWIVHQEQEGASRAEVEQILYREYGDQLRQTPRAEGMGVLAYVIPAALALAGLALVLLFFRGVRARGERSSEQPPPGPGAAAAPLDPELARQVDAELAAAERGE